MPDMPKETNPTPELLPTPEVGVETPAEQPLEQESAPRAEEKPAEAPVSSVVPAAANPALDIDPTVAKVEDVLSENLAEIYANMPPERQQAFKLKGEETVSKIIGMFSQAVIKAKEVLKLILDWLKLIPGVNKYYLEQESKIKTDKILEIHRRTRGE